MSARAATASREDVSPLTEEVRHLRKGLAFAGLVSLFLNLLMLVVPLYMLQVYDRVLTSGSLDTLTMLTIVAAGGLCIYGVLEYLRSRLYLVMGDRLARRLNLPTLQASVSATLDGDPAAASQASRSLGDLRNFVTGNAISVPLEAVWVPVYLIILFLMHPLYGIVAIASAVILVTLGVVTDLVTRKPLAAASRAASENQAEVAAAVRNAEVIEAMGMLPALARRWQRGQDRMLERQDRGNSAGKAISAASKALRQAMQVAVLAAGAILVIDRQVTPGTMIAASIIIGRLLFPFEQLTESWRQWVFAGAAYRRIKDLLARQTTRRQQLRLPDPAGRLVVDRLFHVPEGAERPVLRGISFDLEPGEVLGIVGPSAAGKSTLARLLVGLWQPSAGGVYLDGHAVHQWDREDFGRHVGYLPQSVALLDGTVRDNIARMADADPRDVVAAARRAGVHEVIGRLPQGYETIVGESGFALSGGQRQRIGLARALFGRPRLLILDEPNANLDHDGEQALLQTVAEARESGITVVLIAHRPSIIAAADKLLVLKDGQTERFGPRADVLRMVTPGATRPAMDNAAGLRLAAQGERAQ